MFRKTHCVQDAGAEINPVRVIVTDIKLYIIFHIEYKVIEFITNKKEPTITFPIRQYWNDNEAAPDNGGLVNKANNCIKPSRPPR